MPTYEYGCEACNTKFDYEQRMTDDPLDTCIFCGNKDKFRKLLTNPRFLWVKADVNSNLMLTAEANTKKVGEEELQRRELEYQEQRKRAKRELMEQRGIKIPDPVDKSEAWWRSSEIKGANADLNKVTNIQKFIETGETI